MTKEEKASYNKAYYSRPEVKSVIKAASRARYSTKEGKASRKVWASTPIGKASIKAASRAWNTSFAGKIFFRDAKYRRLGILNSDGSQFTTSNVIDAYLLQRGNCKLCSMPLLEDIHVDHDHSTSKFRGLLHRSCNTNQVGNHTLKSALRLVQYLTAPE